MLPDDLVGRIPLYPLRARIPARNVPFRVQHVDSVIGDALHEEAKLLLTFTQCCLGFSTLGQVARDLGKTNQSAGAVPDRIDNDIGPEFRAVLADVPALIFEFTLPGRDFERTGGQAR